MNTDNIIENAYEAVTVNTAKRVLLTILKELYVFDQAKQNFPPFLASEIDLEKCDFTLGFTWINQKQVDTIEIVYHWVVDLRFWWDGHILYREDVKAQKKPLAVLFIWKAWTPNKLILRIINDGNVTIDSELENYNDI